jgi:hypothetical protein
MRGEFWVCDIGQPFEFGRHTASCPYCAGVSGFAFLPGAGQTCGSPFKHDNAFIVFNRQGEKTKCPGQVDVAQGQGLKQRRITAPFRIQTPSDLRSTR